jgi:hypothetical protein
VQLNFCIHNGKFIVVKFQKCGVHVGKGNHPIMNWCVSKLELILGVITNIKANDAAINWTADHTEHAHIEVIKDTARFSHNQKYEKLICHNIDQSDKCHQFDLATAIQDAQIKFNTSLGSLSREPTNQWP